MRLLVLASCLITVAGVTLVVGETCRRGDVTTKFRRSLYDFACKLYKQVASQTDDHFAVSQYSIWLALAGMAEGASGDVRAEILATLKIPDPICLRLEYYELATELESSAEDVRLERTRSLLVDEDLKVNETWMRDVREVGLLDTVFTPQDKLRELLQVNDSSSHSIQAVLSDSLDYSGLWTSSFTSITPNVSFYDDYGNKIGTVDMMTTKRRVKLAYIPILNAKVLELPVGNNGRYRMLLLTNLGKKSIKDTIDVFQSTLIVDIFDRLLQSIIPLEISIPVFSMTSDLRLRSALENLEIRKMWKENKGWSPNPVDFFQRVSLDIKSEGLSPAPGASSSILTSVEGAATGLATAVGREFTANRPFMFALLDATTRTCLFSGAFSKPTH
ncbi:unnamed protein product [Plutella xylostella]|uniref:(diamondback moth) hypothetical protein n=1 Tax=Plutella xylostella TaxID=51655 RepID=A0A8S4E340_PLUXY|nr:unnamed protein product [Plutella xylostella]